MKKIILSLILPEFVWLAIDGFIEENGLAPPLPKREIGPPNTGGPPEIWNFLSPSQKK